MKIFLYNNYRDWLNESLEELKKVKSYASLRYFCSKASVDPGNFVRVLQGKIHLSLKGAASIGKYFKLSQNEQAYFEELILYAKAKTDKEAWESFERLQALKGVNVRTLADHEFIFFSKWHHAVILSLISIMNSKYTERQISRMVSPAITTPEVRESIDLLEKLNMIERTGQGFWRTGEKFVGTGQKWSGQAVRQFQNQMLDLAKGSLNNHESDLRDISTLTLTMPLKELKLVKERITEFRQELMSMVKGFKNDDAVFQLNINLFPVGFLNKD